VAQLNFPETKIDAAVLGLKPPRRDADLPAQDGGGDFDRLVAKAAEKGKSRSECSKASHWTEDNEAGASGDPAASTDAAPVESAANTDVPVGDVTIAVAEPNKDPALPAALVAVLLPVADTPIKLPTIDTASVSRAQAAAASVAANANVNLQQSADPVSAEPGATPIPSADIAALIAALPPAAESRIGKHNTAESAALPQPASEAAKTQPQLPPAPAAISAPMSLAPVAETRTAGGPVQPDTDNKSAKPAVRAEGATNPTSDGPQSIETLLAPTDLELQATGQTVARHFVREVATQYQATADAAGAVRGGDQASAADQVSIRLIHSLHEGRKAVQIHLNPSELGSIDVAMQWQGDRLTAHFVVDRPETLDLLQRDIKILEQSLGDSGFSSDNGGLSFSLRQQMENQGERRPGNSNPTQELPQNAAPDPSVDGPSAVRDGVLVLRV
jgi:chemotaxis protein MotD